ncbi:uncharacterized protein LOC133421576 [Cololabis saira]|uniref:uncharacterized protein LOC133421576 n=1 Tax=Cololabis saira TaxID=129043 RepID=UPI002AD404B0|nr:uncharacterized protein LOC133421576 [Cololabis saira]
MPQDPATFDTEAFWRNMSPLKNRVTGLSRFGRLSEIAKLVLVLPHSNADAESVLHDVPEILRTMKNILDSDLTTPPLPPQSSYSSSANSSPSLPRSTPPSSMSESVTPSLTDSQSSKVEIHPGTGVMVEKLAWTYALNANSATVFVRHLLTAVFPLEILLLSNLRGGKRGGGDARLPLDKKKLDAIYSATLERWPGTQLSSIGTTINGKITELRTKSRNVAVSTASS